jgi:hypothetical protein
MEQHFTNHLLFIANPSGRSDKHTEWSPDPKRCLTLSLLMLHICGVSKMFGEWYKKTNKTEDTNKLTLLAFKIIAILHTTRLATFIKLLKTVSKGLFRNRLQNRCNAFLDCRRRQLSCGTVVCTHFASYQGYPNYR